jgi:2-methylisocitrate lyase-like PEP mutase family enzyme
MSEDRDLAARFLELHHRDRPLLMPNPWDAGSARLLASLGFEALATTSGGYAASLGRRDYNVSREEALAHASTIAAAVEVPVSADLEDCFAAVPEQAAATVSLAREAGLAGCSIEDWDARERRLYAPEQAAERVAAAAEAAHAGGAPFVLTARAENYLRGNTDLEDTIARLQAYEQAGADALYAPALDRPEDLRELIAAVDAPVNVLARPGAPTVDELAALGVKRVSVGSLFAFAALGAAREAGLELLERGTYGFAEPAIAGAQAALAAFASDPAQAR